MLRQPVAFSRRSRSAYSRKPNSKELDLLLLAGCSCLMTLLYHPVADALQSSLTLRGNSSASSAATTSAQVSRAPIGSTGPIHVMLPSERDKIRREDEEE